MVAENARKSNEIEMERDKIIKWPHKFSLLHINSMFIGLAQIISLFCIVSGLALVSHGEVRIGFAQLSEFNLLWQRVNS